MKYCFVISVGLMLGGYGGIAAGQIRPVDAQETGAQSPGRGANRPQVPASPSASPESVPGELRFEPPPVPDFMLRKPPQPMTLEEMQRQADEAAARARRARAGESMSPNARPSAPESAFGQGGS